MALLNLLKLGPYKPQKSDNAFFKGVEKTDR